MTAQIYPLLTNDNPWGPASAAVAALGGRWRMERQIDGEAAFTGVATFTPRGAFLEAREEGRLTLAAGRSFDASRVYLYRPSPGGFSVFFDETPPRLFHDIELAPAPDACLAGEALHRCGDDSYASAYRFLQDGGLYIRHRVWGPRKNYTMATLYGRLA